jgi:chorismate dehydratase
MPVSTLRCGRICYTNDLPIYVAFDRGAVAFPGELRQGVPSELNRAMLAGELDCGPISSYCYAQNPEAFVLLPDVCIGSRDAVRSIYCISKEGLGALRGRPVAVTKESATGRALFSVLCRIGHGFAPEFVESDDPFSEFRRSGTACVVIGDKAIDAYLADGAHAVDLGDLWHQATGCDMVYAVWAVRRETAEARPADVAAVAAALRSALDWGMEHIDAAVIEAQALVQRPGGFYEDYYRALNFRFDDRARAGLRRFFDACAECGMLARSPQLAFFHKEFERV